MIENDIVIVDSDALIAFANKDDLNRERAVKIMEYVNNASVQLLFPTTMITETITTLHKKIEDKRICKKVLDLVLEGNIELYPVTDEIVMIASIFFQPTGSKKNTFFDAVIAGCAQKEKTPYIFSFDKWYEKQGFTLITTP